jgi:hypothetical protein
LIHVEFEDGLSISVLKNWATCHKDLQLESWKLLKKSNLFKGRPTIFRTLPYSSSRVPSNRSRFATVHISVSKIAEASVKSKVMDMISKRFYWLMRLSLSYM